MAGVSGQRIAQLRHAKGWSQQELGIRAGLHMQTITDIERGVRDLRVSTAQKLADALDVTIPDLIAEPAATGRNKTA